MFFDTDLAGVVHNIAYLRHIETARTKLAEKLGWNLLEMANEKTYPVVLRTEIDYRKPAHLSDVIRVEGQIDEVSKIRFWGSFKIFRESNEDLLITCRQQLAIISLPDGRPQRMSDWISH